MAVSLAEITNIRGDAAIGAGTAGTAANLANLPADQFGLQIIERGANAQMLANKYAQEQYQKNIDNTLKDFNALDINGIMEKDYDTILPAYASYSQSLADNLDVIMNPAKNYDRYKELRGKEAQLRGDIAKSKQQLALRKNAMDFISQHKDYETPENVNAVRQFSVAPLNERDISGIIDLQPRVDLMQDYVAKTANATAMKKTQVQNTNSPFMDKTSMTTYYKQAYDEAVDALLQGNDLFNRPMSQNVEKVFNSAPGYIKQQYSTGPDGVPDLNQFAKDQLYGPLRNQDDVSIEKTINPIYKEAMEQKNALARIAESGRQARLTDAAKKKLDDQEIDTFASEIPVRQVAIIKTGDQPAENAEVISLKGKGGEKPTWTVPGNYGTIGGNGGEIKGFPLTLDTWLQNAYSIPTGKEKVVDPVTRQVVSEDSYLRPQKAWVTGDKNPNARKVIVRYDDPIKGETDLVIPYAENLQLLNNVAGQNNAVKLGGAKAQLFKKRYGRISPTYEQLESDQMFQSPNAGTPGAEQQGPGTLPTPPGSGVPAAQQQEVIQAVVPTNTSTGKTLNYAEWKKQQGRQ